MRVAVANPPWPGEGFGARSDVRWPHKRKDKYIEYPIYLAYTVAVLDEAGVEVSFIDAIMEELDIPAFVQRVKEIDPALLVMECSTPSIRYDLQSAAAVKAALPGVRIALIGSHPTFFHRDILQENSDVDAIVRGEFEITVLELARAIEQDSDWSSVEGLSYRRGDAIVVNPPRQLIDDLDSLPFPARHIVHSNGYRAAIYSGDKCTAIVSSRGCPFQCTFCVWPNTLYGHKFRARSAENVVDEMEEIEKKYGIDEIYFDDDTFTIDRERVMDICHLIVERDLHVSWIIQARVDTVDRQMLVALKEAGCHYILFGIESGSPEMLATMKKRITLDKAREAIRLCDEVGIKSQAFFLFGIPGETQESIRQTIEFAKELGASTTQFAVAIPQPGSPLYEQCVQNNWLLYDDWEDFASCSALIETPQLSRQEVEQARVRAYREYYFRPRFILREALRIRHPKDVRRLLRGARSVLARLSFFESARSS
jgi:anaerobic magnesium-protoporphyrin IX monomethyl ester cyclase